MQTPDRYWSGIYWDGLNPLALGAQPLNVATSEQKTVSTILTHAKGMVDDVTMFHVTMHADSKQEILCRLWHNDVFAGARNSCNGDPGEKCMDLHYNRDTGAFLGKTKMDEPLK